MAELQGGRGVVPSPNALRTSGWRPTAIRPEFRKLVDAISVSRGLSKAAVIEQALIRMATIEEADEAGLVE